MDDGRDEKEKDGNCETGHVDNSVNLGFFCKNCLFFGMITALYDKCHLYFYILNPYPYPIIFGKFFDY